MSLLHRLAHWLVLVCLLPGLTWAGTPDPAPTGKPLPIAPRVMRTGQSPVYTLDEAAPTAKQRLKKLGLAPVAAASRVAEAAPWYCLRGDQLTVATTPCALPTVTPLAGKDGQFVLAADGGLDWQQGSEHTRLLSEPVRFLLPQAGALWVLVGQAQGKLDWGKVYRIADYRHAHEPELITLLPYMPRDAIVEKFGLRLLAPWGIYLLGEYNGEVDLQRFYDLDDLPGFKAATLQQVGEQWLVGGRGGVALVSRHYANIRMTGDDTVLYTASGSVEPAATPVPALLKVHEYASWYCISASGVVSELGNTENQCLPDHSYQWLRTGNGSYVATDRGEFGHGLVWQQAGQSTRLLEENIRQLLVVGDDLYVLCGLSHLSSSHGSIYRIVDYRHQHVPALITLLPFPPLQATASGDSLQVLGPDGVYELWPLHDRPIMQQLIRFSDVSGFAPTTMHAHGTLLQVAGKGGVLTLSGGVLGLDQPQHAPRGVAQPAVVP
jgi:hypothetical protein